MKNAKMKIEAVKEWLVELKAPKKPIKRVFTTDDLAKKFNKK